MSKPPADIIRSVPEGKVLTRLDTLVELFNKAFRDFTEAHLNVKLLRHAVVSYFLDLGRMKDFHGITHADRHKRAAFTMLWVVRAHPVQLHTNANMTEALIVINELFAIHAGLSHLNMDIAVISDEYIRNLIYILHFRQVAPEILASAMYLLERACRKETP